MRNRPAQAAPGDSTAPFMFSKLKIVMVELSTPKGSVFSGQAGGVELLTTDGAIAINPQEESYLNLTQTTQMTLRVGTEFLSFVLKNAAASLRDGCLTVLAEEVQPMPAASVSAESRNGGPTEAASPKTITTPSKQRKP